MLKNQNSIDFFELKWYTLIDIKKEIFQNAKR